MTIIWKDQRKLIQGLNLKKIIIRLVLILNNSSFSLLSCLKSYLRLLSSGSEIVYCGDKPKNGNFQFQSSSNELTILYKTSSTFDGQYRGFNLYFEGKTIRAHFSRLFL